MSAYDEIQVIYEDDDVCVVSKPTGLIVHADGVRKEETLADWFVERVPESRGVGEPLTLSNGTKIDRPGIVHRLDKGTSGIIILVKNEEAFIHLKTQFQNRSVLKEYRAFIWGSMKESSGSIELPIGRSRGDFRKRSAEFGAKPPLREAHTGYETLVEGKEYSYLSLIPKTGRTHQLRVHLKALSHPIVCDALYAPRRGCALGFDRLALHAYQLKLTLPSGESKAFVSPLPDDFLKAEKLL